MPTLPAQPANAFADQLFVDAVAMFASSPNSCKAQYINADGESARSVWVQVSDAEAKNITPGGVGGARSGVGFAQQVRRTRTALVLAASPNSAISDAQLADAGSTGEAGVIALRVGDGLYVPGAVVGKNDLVDAAVLIRVTGSIMLDGAFWKCEVSP